MSLEKSDDLGTIKIVSSGKGQFTVAAAGVYYELTKGQLGLNPVDLSSEQAAKAVARLWRDNARQAKTREQMRDVADRLRLQT